MNPVEYLKGELQNIAKSFPNVHIKYAFNDKVNLHIVELLPLFEYLSNPKLDEAWIPVAISFSEKFQEEEVTFISSDSRLSIKDALFEFNETACSEENIIWELFSEIASAELNYEFSNAMPNGRIMDNIFFNLLKREETEQESEQTYNINAYSEAA